MGVLSCQCHERRFRLILCLDAVPSHPLSLTELDLSNFVALISFTLWTKAATRSSPPWMEIMSFLRNLPLSIQRLTIYICCEDGCDPGFLRVEESSGWEEIRSRLGGLLNLTDLSFVVQHGEQHISDPENIDYKEFDARLRTKFEQELFSLREQRILSISSCVVVRFGPQD